jgi:hypothetical protein
MSSTGRRMQDWRQCENLDELFTILYPGAKNGRVSLGEAVKWAGGNTERISEVIWEYTDHDGDIWLGQCRCPICTNKEGEIRDNAVFNSYTDHHHLKHRILMGTIPT